MTDHYHVLGVHRNATDEQIRKAYHKLALKFHPDKNVLNGRGQMARINEAYTILSDPEKRVSYDQSTSAPSSVVHHDILQGFDSMCRWISGSLERYNRDNDIPYGMIIVGSLIGGTVFYMKYMRGQVTPPPPLSPILEAVIPTTAIEPEISEIHPRSLWTLAALLAALRSKNLLRLAKPTASSQGKIIAKTLVQGSQSGLSSAAKIVNSGTKAPFVGYIPRKVPTGGSKGWTWAAGFLPKVSRRLLNFAARSSVRAIQYSKSGLSYAAAKSFTGTVWAASKVRRMRAVDSISAAKRIKPVLKKYARRPVLEFKLRRFADSAARTSVRAIQYSKSNLSSAATKMAAATVRMRPANWFSAWRSAVNTITKFSPSSNIIYVEPRPLRSFDPMLAPKSPGYKRTIKGIIIASVIGSLGYVFLR